MSNEMFVGFGDGRPFNSNHSVERQYVFDLRGGEIKFLHGDGRHEDNTGWKREIIKSYAERGTWKYITLNEMKAFFPSVDFDAAVSTPTSAVPVVAPVRTKPTEIKKSALYYNSTSERVERVITIQDKTLIWTSSHKEMAKPYPRSAFYLASSEEVKAYLKEADAND